MPALLALLALLACDRTPVPAAATAPAPEPAPPELAAPDAPAGDAAHAALLAAGVCGGEGQISDTREIPLPDGRVLLEVLCAMYAYQGAYGYAWASSGEPVRDQDGAVLDLVGLPFLEPDGTLVWLEKARGPGDCGAYHRYLLEGDRFVRKEHRVRPCSDAVEEEDVPTPDTWPLVFPAPSATHCDAAETIHFSCSTSGSKVLSLCGGPGRLQYRFGPVGAPELEHPPDSRIEAFTVEHRSYPRFEADVATFTTGGFTYAVTEASGGGGGPDAESNNFAGVYVLQGDDVVASVPCTGPVSSRWEPLLLR